ncbi:hypothetical protein [Azonexus sp.]|uniref:hypothetical protein n=1 Tax=Azonexus sp. TaxID=1872668 RepID=UPI0035AEAD31
MINIGGFGHSGNTALVDFLADNKDICQIGYDFTESAIIRSKWGLRAVLGNFQKNNLFVEWDLIRDCLLGVSRDSHSQFQPPVHHDFIRNARVRGYLGSGYNEIVDWFIESVADLYLKSNLGFISLRVLLDDFIKRISDLAILRSGRTNALPLMRNDPAAANIDLLGFFKISYQFVTVRNPADMMIDWISYYGHSNDALGAKKFSKQFVNKISQFINSYNCLENDVKNRIKFVDFQRLVRSGEYRFELCDLLGIDKNFQLSRFNPEKSQLNIGISKSLSKEGENEVSTSCLPMLDKLIASVDSKNVVGGYFEFS